MSRSHVVFVVLVILLTSRSALAQSLGTPSLGWVTITGSQAIDSGFVDVGAYAYQVEYHYSPTDTVTSVLAGLKGGFDSPASPVTASIAGDVLVLTSKTTGSASNSSSLFAIYFGTSFSTNAIGMIGGRDGPRNFRMGMYNDPDSTNADITFTAINFAVSSNPQVPGHSILGMYNGFQQPSYVNALNAWWLDGFADRWNSLISQPGYDPTRIDAVNIDEPYLQLFTYLGYSTAGDPCTPADRQLNPRYDALWQGHDQLQKAAAAIKQTSPTTRFWVNFEASELAWMRNGSCAFFNAPYIDVVSLDYYQVDFLQTVKPDYDWLRANPGYAGQQLALVPGTFVGRGSDPATQAADVEEYFDYATNLNQSCILPLGSGFVTGRYDGCPVWIVGGFPYNTVQDGNYIGLADPAAAAVQAAWFTELSVPPVDYGLPAIQIFALQPLLN